jgi:hypothetical protein
VIREVAGLAGVNVLLAVFGYGLLATLGWPGAESILVRSGVSLSAGLAGFFAVMPPLLYAGFSPTVAVLTILALLALAAGMARRDHRSGDPWPGRGATVLGAALALPFLLLGLQAAVKEPVEVDWQLDWALKAHMLAGHGGLLRGALDPRFLSSRLYQGSHPEYPIGLPALQALDYHAMGSMDTIVVHLQYALALAAFAVTVWALLHAHADPVLRTAGAVAVLASPAVEERVLRDPWDVMTACFWVCGALLVGLWYEDGDRRRLALAVLFVAAALETKLEALSNTLILLTLVGLLLVVARQWPRLRELALGAVAVAVLIAPWQLYSRTHGLHSKIVSPSLRRMDDQLGDLSTIAHSLANQTFASAWEAAIPLCVCAAAVMLLRDRSRPLAGGFLILLCALELGLVFVYWNHTVNLRRLLDESAGRTITTEELLALALLPLLLDRALGDLRLGWLAARRRPLPGAAACARAARLVVRRAP